MKFKRAQIFFKGNFFKNVTVLMSGSVIAQGLAFAVSPILTRIYDPNAFGQLGLFIAVVSVVFVSASAKYELAILLPKEDEDAVNILTLSIGIVLLVVTLSFLVVLLWRDHIAELMSSPKLSSLLWWAP